MKLFDLHCDTPFRLYHENKHITENDLHISLSKASAFERYIQCAAVWSDNTLSDSKCLDDFFKIEDYFEKEAGPFIKTANDLERRKQGFILSVEDARLIFSDIGLLSVLYEKGVRILTLLWKGESAVGHAWDVSGPLTPFGKELLWKCFEIGIIPDLSHANDEAVTYALNLAKKKGKPIVATHSNSRTVCPHKRNLSDDKARMISDTGGIVGISLFPAHLRGETADISDIMKHITHYIDLLGTDSLCLGCDFDGIGSTPEEISSVFDLSKLYNAVTKDFGSLIAEKIFFNNAYNFFINNLQREV